MAPTTPETAKAAADMKKSDVKDFASTSIKNFLKRKLLRKVVMKDMIQKRRNFLSQTTE